MKSSELKDKVSGFFKDFSIDKTIEFVKKNIRYFAAGALFAVLVLILATCTKPTNDANGVDETEAVTDTTEEKEYQVNANQEINDLIKNYYDAYAAGDLDTLQKYAHPVSDNEKSFIKMFSDYVDEYQNIKCYTKQGLDSKSYLVSVYLEIKFKDVTTTAPGLDFFYVSTDDDGNLYIDNLYSQFNLLNQEQDLDSNVKALIDSFELESDVLALQTDVQQKYEAAIASDENLKTMIDSTIADAYNTWAQSVTTTETTTEAPAATETPTTTTPEATTVTPEAITTTPEATTTTPAAPTTETVYTTDTVNIRAQGNESAAVVEKVAAGTALTRTGTTEDGWSKLDYNGTEAYVKNDYVSTTAPQTAAAPASVAEGTQVTLSQTVNIRSSMSETADKVGTAFSGEKVTVVMSYAEGWTKVDWNGKSGYIKTEFLK